jgi:hypothetical protein
MVSIPISDRCTGISFRSVAYSSPCGTTLADILPSIGCHLEASEEVHLDPDLRKESREKRAEGWRPMFGQCGGAQAHLNNQCVGLDDLFLFYGYFKALDDEFVKREGFREGHVIFGWLQAGGRHLVNDEARRALAWGIDHPHLRSPFSDRVRDSLRKRKEDNNTVFVARDSLSFLPSMSGGGVFPQYYRDLCLTQDPSLRSGRSRWHSFLDGRTRHRQEHVIEIGSKVESQMKDWLHLIFNLPKTLPSA